MIRKILKITAIAAAVIFFGIQLYRPNRTHPPIVEAETLEPSAAVPDDVAAILKRSCNDCHSHTTLFPWYSNIAPFSWVLIDHVDHGRSHLNFSVWNTYETTKKIRKLEEICEQLESKAMPLPSYLWLHRDAILTDDDSKVLCDWAIEQKEKLLSSPTLAPSKL